MGQRGTSNRTQGPRLTQPRLGMAKLTFHSLPTPICLWTKERGTGAGGATTGGTGGTATGGVTTGGTGGTATGGSAGSQVVDAEAVADATSSEDGGIDVPLSTDTSLSSDLGTGGSDGAGTDGTGGTGTGGTGGAIPSVIISVRFVGGRPGGSSGTTTMNATESAGFKPATNWNSATSGTGTLSSLAAADGSTTTASIAWTAPSTYTVPFTDASGDAHMMNGFIQAIDTVSVTINMTLPSSMSGGYDVYVYCYGNIDPTTRTYQYKIGSTTHTVSQTGRSATTFPGHSPAPAAGGTDGGTGSGTYVLFQNVTGTSFVLTATPAGSTALPTPILRAPVNGIQIVYPSGF